ncbi:hypothetical protein CTI14_54125, partial [Methylobacterium radiotolerans]
MADPELTKRRCGRVRQGVRERGRGERIRDRLAQVVVAALDAMIATVRDAGLDADRCSAIVAALE